MSARGSPLTPATGILAALCLASGCGSIRGSLEGQVTYQGKPVCCGSVVAVGSDGVTKSVQIQEDGSYAIPDLPGGPVRIAVYSPNPQEVRAQPSKFGTPPPPAGNPKWFAIPDKYGDLKSSGITCNIREKTNSFNIELD